MYEQLLEAGLDAGYEHITVREYLSDESLPERFIIHRHDVDRKAENALAMARLEAKHGISATYYVRSIKKTFKPRLIKQLHELGHEVGYHYEDMDRADGDLEAAHLSFEAELARLRTLVPVETVCMHGNPLTAHDNRDMWESRDFDTYDLLGEAYLSMDFVDVTYYSDTGRTWEDGDLKVKDNPVGESTKATQVGSTPQLIQQLRTGNETRYCLLSHPNRWADTVGEYLIELSKDTLTNVGKRGLQVVR